MPSGSVLGISNRSGCRVCAGKERNLVAGGRTQYGGAAVGSKDAQPEPRPCRNWSGLPLGSAPAPARRLAGLRGRCDLGARGLSEAIERELLVVRNQIGDRALVGDARVPFGLLAIIECVHHRQTPPDMSRIDY